MNNEIENLVRINKSQVEPAAEALTKAFKEVVVRARARANQMGLEYLQLSNRNGLVI
jgi:hypothetical protein